MANWNGLAPEVHDIILSLFCQEIINEYTSFVLVLDDILDLKPPPNTATIKNGPLNHRRV